MLNKTLIILLIWSNLLNAYYVENNNSIFKVSNNARINSIGGLHILSNEISGVFNQPIALNNNIKGNSYYSYLKYFDNIINVHQLGFCVLDNPKKELLEFVRKITGEEDIDYDESVAQSELSSGYRNIALVNYMKALGNIKCDVEEIIVNYLLHLDN